MTRPCLFTKAINSSGVQALGLFHSRCKNSPNSMLNSTLLPGMVMARSTSPMALARASWRFMVRKVSRRASSF